MRRSDSVGPAHRAPADRAAGGGRAARPGSLVRWVVAAGWLALAPSWGCGGLSYPEGRYACTPGEPGTCPAGFVCRWSESAQENRCFSRGIDAGVPGDSGASSDAYVPPAVEETNLDVIILLDNSADMGFEQENLRQHFSVFLESLRVGLGGLPNLHIGIVTSDLGTGAYDSIAGCTEVGGDRGRLGWSSSGSLGTGYLFTGSHFIVDRNPVGCPIVRAEGRCTQHSCSQDNCSGTGDEPGPLAFVVDPETNCPRCVNYNGSFADAFFAYADVGQEGCGFEQQLEAVRKALDPGDPEARQNNAGFLRDDSFLMVLYVTSEDDCSAARPDILFNPDPSLEELDSLLGPLSSFRCFEFGVTCDVDDREVQGPRHDCVPRPSNDPNLYLYPVERYVSFFEALRDPARFLVAAIAGPVPDAVYVTLMNGTKPRVEPTCTIPDAQGSGATPGIRIRALVSAFDTESELREWGFTSACSEDYSEALSAMARRLARKIQTGR